MHSQSGQPQCTAGIAMIIPAAPIIEPIERSNSPPIISIEAATAMMPSWADTSRKLRMPGRREQAAAAGHDGEEDEDQDRPRHGAELGPRHELADDGRLGHALVGGRHSGCGHGKPPRS